MRCVAIDDEPIALSIINEYCRMYGDIELHTFTSPHEGIEGIRRLHPEVIFLDIEMNSYNGIDIARELPNDICVIFTTAYSQYAMEGFNVDAVDFLHKPFFYPRFEQAMQKAKRYLSSSGEQIRSDNILTIKVGHKNLFLNMADICYMEAMDNYIKIFRKNLPPVVTQMTMKEMEQNLPKDRFIRIHRSYIVALAGIERYSSHQIYLRDSSRTLPVGRKYLEQFKSLTEL